MIEIKNVTKKYHDEMALHDITMNLTKGMNFIIGSSGSGKTTLLKLISGMQEATAGEILYCGTSMMHLHPKEKSYFYNSIFGFVWQDYHLIESETVLDNVLLPCYVKQSDNQKYAATILKELKLTEYTHQKVKFLSGGQKQRVAIARELMKNPNVILADEPTSALDEESAQIILQILRSLAKHKTVIIVTHDTTLIEKNDTVFELDKGELVASENTKKYSYPKMKKALPSILSYKNAFTILKRTRKHHLARGVSSILTLMIASVMLLTTLSGAIQQNTQGEFDKLLQTYGDSLLDLSVIQNFTNASGTDESQDKKPNGDVSQNIEGLFEKYANDARITHLLHIQAYENIKITMDEKEYSVESTGNSPMINKLLSGRIPDATQDEVLVPESFTKKAGLDKDSILGKEILFSSSIYNWESGEPLSKNVQTKAKIVGVIDTKAVYEVQGNLHEYSIDDSFFFSKTTLAKMRKQADIKNEQFNFVIRAKTPADLIHIKDELNAQGIVPLGQFELVEDMVRLQEQTTTQSSSASIIIASLSFVLLLTTFLFTGCMRRREYAIYKAAGYDNKALSKIIILETIEYSIWAIIFSLALSPIFNMMTRNFFNTSILNISSLFILVILIIISSLSTTFVTYLTYRKTDINDILKSGER